LVLAVVLVALGMRNFCAIISFGFCLFVILTVLAEFYKGARAIAAKSSRPHLTRGPSGSPHSTLDFLPRRSTSLEAAGRFGNAVNCARIWRYTKVARSESDSAAPTAEHSPARRASTLKLRVPSATVRVAGAWQTGSGIS
jgi:hypothetical protein